MCAGAASTYLDSPSGQTRERGFDAISVTLFAVDGKVLDSGRKGASTSPCLLVLPLDLPKADQYRLCGH